MKILIVGPSWVGDSVISQSLFKVIKSNNKDSKIEVLAPEWTKDIFDRMKEVSKTILLPFDHGEIKLKDRVQLGKSLKNSNYDLSFVLPNSFKSSLVPFYADIPLRTGWRGEYRYFLLNDLRKLNELTYPRMVDRFIALGLKELDILPTNPPYPSLEVDIENLKRLSSQYGIDLNKPSIALCPGAEFGPAKRWPAYYYAKVAKEFLSKGWQILLLGSPNDISVGEQIEQDLDSKNLVLNLIGKTKLVDAVDILSVAEIVVSNDSGLMHVAAALDTQLLALYGPSSPNFTPPLSKRSVVMRKNKGYSKARKGSGSEGYHPSLLDIKPSEVIESLNSMTSSVI